MSENQPMGQAGNQGRGALSAVSLHGEQSLATGLADVMVGICR
jgi:hypothetical protein